MTKHIHNVADDIISSAISRLVIRKELSPDIGLASVSSSPPKDPSHGDLSSGIAMRSAKQSGMAPRVLAQLIVAEALNDGRATSVDVAGPGFINIRLDPVILADEIMNAALADMPGHEDEPYGSVSSDHGPSVSLEFVSANPTGPVHVGHARGAVIGSAIANLLEFTGNTVLREYYVNDAGAQVEALARSVHQRYREALGLDFAITDGEYPGEYLRSIGLALAEEYGDHLLDLDDRYLDHTSVEARAGVNGCLVMIKESLARTGVFFDLFTHESDLAGAAGDEAFAVLRNKDLIFEGELPPPYGIDVEKWRPRVQTIFRSTAYGDDQDRALTREDGEATYFANDIVHHASKIAADHDRLVTVLGEDHSGYVARIVAAVRALSDGRMDMEVPVVRMVNIMKDGQPFRMSKREDNFVTLDALVDEIGPSALRMIMLSRHPDTSFSVDVAKVVETNLENPVWAANYAHARVRSVLDRAQEAGLEIAPSGAVLSRLESRSRSTAWQANPIWRQKTGSEKIDLRLVA